MEKNVDLRFYLTLSSKAIASTRKKANEEAYNAYGEEDSTAADTLLYEDVSFIAEELYFDKDNESITYSGDMTAMGERLGYLSGQIKLSGETVVEIIEHYMKKLGKLKTVMEAIK